MPRLSPATESAIVGMILEGTDPKLVAHANNVSAAKVYSVIHKMQLRKTYLSETERVKLMASRKGINL